METELHLSVNNIAVFHKKKKKIGLIQAFPYLAKNKHAAVKRALIFFLSDKTLCLRKKHIFPHEKITVCSIIGKILLNHRAQCLVLHHFPKGYKTRQAEDSLYFNHKLKSQNNNFFK